MATIVKLVSAVLIVAALVLLSRALPIDNGIQFLEMWIQGLGVWAPLVYALVYAVATVLFIPGSALTLAAGAIFGLWWGTVAVSIGATTGAALAFLIARYAARRKVAEMAASSPKFSAIDKAIGEEAGWKMVAMLRLSPAVPFNLQNYLYGLTAIRFWPCMLASWLFMLPGTFLYVYLGHLGGQGLSAAAGTGTQGRGTGEWIMLVVGLLATVGVTVYVTRLANRAIQKHTAAEVLPAQAAPDAAPPAPHGWPASATVMALVAVLIFSSALYAYIERDSLMELFGPPRVTLAEVYEAKPNGPAFDHSEFDALLWNHVDDDGWVDYQGLSGDQADLDAYIAAVAEAPFNDMGRDQKLALLINAYNAFTLRLILDYQPIRSIFDIPSGERWEDARWNVGGHVWSLTQIEHEQIRPKFIEPRIHFALVCAAAGCPKLSNEAYEAERLEEQLTDQARYSHEHGRWFRFEPAEGAVHLTQLYQWYGGDFEQTAGSVLDYAAQYSPELKQALDAGNVPAIGWLVYDWNLNTQNLAN